MYLLLDLRVEFEDIKNRGRGDCSLVKIDWVLFAGPIIENYSYIYIVLVLLVVESLKLILQHVVSSR